MKALITGVSGQDGSHMADHLVSEGYEVHGLVRRHGNPNYGNIRHLLDAEALTLHEGDLCDARSVHRIIEDVRPDELYHLGAQSHVFSSFEQPQYTLDATGYGLARVLEGVRAYAPRCRVYQASSSEQFGNILTEDFPDNRWKARGLLDEQAPFHPQSPYASAKVLAHNIAHMYREAYGTFVSCGILFNHEGPRRGSNFVTRKITLAAARIKCGLQKRLVLGNLSAVRDWGYAPEYVEAMWRMLQRNEAGDWVVATGEGHTVQEFLDKVMVAAGVPWPDAELVTTSTGQQRPSDVHRLVGDASKARRDLGWTPRTDFDGLVRIMVDHDLQEARRDHAQA